ncbi:hypothetical protein GCM10010405_43450 [Streptomyces macrosporus]|uniref:Uncharacterized protein n=1 Tax=Streptomyces macrosporus TaxID=44032 RepID=A0ABN3KF92_9ACTN
MAGRRRGVTWRPRSGLCLVGRPATPGFRLRLSWVLAAETPTIRGRPFASDGMRIVVPGLLRGSESGPTRVASIRPGVVK